MMLLTSGFRKNGQKVTRGQKFPKNYMSIFTARKQILYQVDPLFTRILKVVVEKPPEVI